MAPEEFTQKIHELTSTPRTVLLLLLEGKTDDEIAAVITASPATVRKHVQNLADHFDLKREVAGLKRNRRKDLVALATPYKPALTNSQTPNYTEQEQISESVVREFMAQQVDNCIRMVKPLSSKAKTRSSNIDESTNQNQNLQPKNLELYQDKDRLAFVLSGTIDEDEKAHLEVILPHLQKFSRDVTLSVSKIQPEPQTTLDEQLCQVISAVIQNPDGSPQQRQAMDRLLRLIPKLPGIRIPKRADIDDWDAFNRALEAVSCYQGNISGKNIRKFRHALKLDLNNNHSKKVMAQFVHWFTMIFKRKKNDVFREHSNSIADGAMDMRETIENSFPDRSLDVLDQMIVAEQVQGIQEIITNFWQYIREDPERKLRGFYLRGRPECNCQEFAKRRLLKEPPDQWKDIAQDLNVPLGTAASLWKRKCEPLLKEIVLNLESD